MMAPTHARAEDARGLLARMAIAAGLVGLLLASFVTAMTGSGSLLVGAGVGVLGTVLVLRRPVVGVLILMTTFLFTYPAFLRGIGNLTINNVLGLLLVPTMLYEMVRDRSWWVVRFKPFLILGTIVLSLLVSSAFYSGESEFVQQAEQAKIEASARAQGPALFQTRDEAAKLVTRLAFVVLFVFFVRTARDLQFVVAIVVAALLFTYFSVSTGEGQFGWGTGRLRALTEAGGALYAGRNPNKLAYFALMGLTLLWYARRALPRKVWYLPWAVATGITFIMIPLTGSRSGMLNLLLFVIILLLEGRFSYRKILGAGLIALVFVMQFAYQASVLDLLLPQQTAERLGRVGVRAEIVQEEGLLATGSAGGRFRTLQSAATIWSMHPFFGVGIGNFESERAAIDPFGVVGPPHNSYLWALSEGGMLVFGLYVWLFVWTFRRIQDIRWEYEARFGPMRLGWLVSAMRTVLIGFMFFSIFADMWYHDFFYIVIGLSLAIIRMHEVYAGTGQVPGAVRAVQKAVAPRAVPRAPVVPMTLR